MNRRDFIRSISALTGLGAFEGFTNRALGEIPLSSRRRRPNILIIMVDQQRYPRGMEGVDLNRIQPNVAWLRSQSVEFSNFFTAATQCTPARATLLTGLYTHQTFQFITGSRDPYPLPAPGPRGTKIVQGFPTWGSLLQREGYLTSWFGKWHLSNAPFGDTQALAEYGFDHSFFGNIGGAGAGYRLDAVTTNAFGGWLEEEGVKSIAPWCATVSLINPHDIHAYYSGTDAYYTPAPDYNAPFPENFETLEELRAHDKPLLHAALLEAQNGPTSAANAMLFPNGALPGAKVTPTPSNIFPEGWNHLLNTYLLAQHFVDREIGRVLEFLEAFGQERDTAIIFLSDHGEHGGAHGLRDKGNSIYEESIHVPLLVSLPDRRHANTTRTQLVSSVDIIGLLLSFATGSDLSWRYKYPWLRSLADLRGLIEFPREMGRLFVTHTSDLDTINEFNPTQTNPIEVPSHIIGIRTQEAKYGRYSFWEPGSLQSKPTGQQEEFYNYRTVTGQKEIVNQIAPYRESEEVLFFRNLLDREVIPLLRAPLENYGDFYLQTAQELAKKLYFAPTPTI